MAEIFSVAPGAVAVVTGPATPMRLYLGDWPGHGVMKAVVTSFEIAMEGNLQFMHSLRDLIHVFSFGERLVQVSVRGIAMSAACAMGPVAHGLEAVIGYYLTNRASLRELPVPIVFGNSTALLALLLGMTARVADPSSVLGEFELQFRALPGGSL